MAESLITQHIDLWTSAIEAKSTAGRGSKNKFDLYGIKKLRELILELAVRGKLVPQDPNDEPASILLEKITAGKIQFINSKKIKKSSELQSINDEGKPFELPNGWMWTSLAEIAEINPRNIDISDDVDVSFIPMPLISTDISGYHEAEIRKWIEIKTGYTHFAEGDIAIAKITPCFENSKAVIFSNLKNGVGAGTTELHVARPYSAFINKRFILLCLKTPTFLKCGEYKMTGSAGQKRVPKEYFSSATIGFPPELEQQRIVAKVDELMALCDQLEQQTLTSIDAHATLVETLLETLTNSADAAELEQNWARISEHFDTLFTTEQSIDALKQTILQLAVMGKLVRQDPTDEPASVLLEKIAAEKAQLIKDKKIKKEKPLPPISDDEKPFELPQGWEWCRLGSITSSRLGKMLDNAKNKGVMKKYLRNTNVQWGMIDLSDLKEMKFEESEFEEFRLKSGDLLVCEGGEPGRCAIWELDDSDIFFQKALHRVRTYAGVDASFIEINLLVSAGNGGLDGLVTGATIKHLPGDKLAIYPIPLPPLKMQIKIIKKVKKLLMLCDELKNKLKNNRETKLHITDSIIDKVIV